MAGLDPRRLGAPSVRGTDCIGIHPGQSDRSKAEATCPIATVAIVALL